MGKSTGMKKQVKKKTKVRKCDRRRIIKNPLTAWIFFCNLERVNIVAQNPNISFGDICKKLAPVWTAMQDKSKYYKMQADDKVRYTEQKRNLCVEERRLLRAYKQQRKVANENRPKAPTSAYMYFVIHTRKRLCVDNPDSDFKEIGRILGREWSTLSAEGRSLFHAMYLEDKHRFETEKLQMVSPGVESK
jgi:hypothetical protein